MKILLLGSKEYPFNSSYKWDKCAGGGYEVHVDKLAKYLVKSGHEVVIVTRRFPDQSVEEDFFDGKLKVFRVSYMHHQSLRTITYLRNSYVFLKKYFKDNTVDVLHAHGAIAAHYCDKLSKSFRIPYVYTPHGVTTGWPFPLLQLLTRWEDHSVKRAGMVYHISTREKRILAKKNGKFANMLITNAIDLDDYKSSIRRNWKEVRFIFLGRLEEIKGIKYMMDAFNRLVKKDIENGKVKARLFVAGKGRYTEWMKDYISKNDLYDHVVLYDWVTDVPAMYGQTDVFVLPSWERGQPFAMLEAQAAGKLVLSSLPYIVDGKSGVKCKSKDTADLYKKMKDIAVNYTKYKKIAAAGKKDVESRGWSAVVDKIVEGYNIACMQKVK
ncbi:MAG: glycosyltransferase family 4 protein [Candidatus Aenigmarchaeota archaeon]|nr:glycosyltransferase family 4 protein [Candidatus Aenigmarchaeota archaeon]